MVRKLTCIECPKGCSLSVKVKLGAVVMVSGQKCPKGRLYASSEIENPLRTLTSCVLAQGMPFKMVPVRTDRPIPKGLLLEAMAEVKRLKVKKRVHTGDVIARDFLGLGVNLVVTREFSI